MEKIHLDEAKQKSIAALKSVVESQTGIEKAVLIDDVFGMLRLLLWSPSEQFDSIKVTIDQAMTEAAGPFWSGEIWQGLAKSESDKILYDRAWQESKPISGLQDTIRVAERRRNRTVWFQTVEEPPWPVDGDDAGPPILTFYSFKGGVGRTTALAAFAIQRAREGERIVVVDLDLDAPGAGTLLAADVNGTTAQWGVIDYLLERPRGEMDLRDYYHACRREQVTGKGEILVVPAGVLSQEKDYLNKLARIDLDPPNENGDQLPLLLLLDQIRKDLDPQWILLDSRAGLAESAGILLGGIAHLNVVFGTSSEQSWQGVRMILDRVGADRVKENKQQVDCIIVHAMVSEDVNASEIAKEEFQSRSLEEFRDHYYAEDPEDPDEDRLVYIRDSETSYAPHVPSAISYQQKLAHFRRIDDVADFLTDSSEYRAMSERIYQRFGTPQEITDGDDDA